MNVSTFGQYEDLVNSLAQYPDSGKNLVYPALGLCGESGEVADKIKKWWRNYGITDGSRLNGVEKGEIIREVGDVLWYLAALARELGTNLENIAYQNALKLLDRNKRNVIKSEGDNR